MKRRMYSVRDNKTVFWSPVEGYTDFSAVRDFEILINKGEVTKAHPSDFDLYFVGTFDSDTAVFEPATPIEFVCSGMSVFHGGKSDEE